MSTYYEIHTEVKFGEVWHCVDPLVLHVKTQYHEQEYILGSTYENGSRSFFGRSADKLQELSERFSFDDLSEELKADFMKWRIPPEEIPDEVMRYSYCIPLDQVRKAVSKINGKANHAIVPKDQIVAFETGEADGIYDHISPKEYSKLDEEAKKVYQYYEWDDWMQWECHFKKILESADWHIGEFLNANCIESIKESRLILTIT